MIYIEEKIEIKNLKFQQEENNYGLITIISKEIILLKKITLKNNKFIFAIGYLHNININNNSYIYEYYCFNYKKYMKFQKNIFEKNKNILITNNSLDNENGFLYIDPISHELSISSFKINNFFDLELYKTFLINKNIELFNKKENIKIKLLYPIIEIHEDLTFRINENHKNINIIYNILEKWTDFQKNRILKLTYEENTNTYEIKISNILYTRKILEYNYINKNSKIKLITSFNEKAQEFQQEEKPLTKEINIYYEAIKIKPLTSWEIIKNIGYNTYIYNNPIGNLNIKLKCIPENLKLNTYIKYENLFFKINKIYMEKNSHDFLCEINSTLYKEINILQELNFIEEDKQILEYKYPIEFEEIFLYDKKNHEVIFKEKIYKDYIYTKSEII